MKNKYYCSICNKEINYNNAHYGKGYCQQCSFKLRFPKITYCCMNCGYQIKTKSALYGGGLCQVCAGKQRIGLKHPRIINLKGKRFNKLLVLEITNKRTKNRKVIWKCICDCGNICYKDSSVLLYGNQKSCGKCKQDYTNRNCSIKGKGHPRFSHGLGHEHIKYSILKRYNLKPNEYTNLLKSQKGVCAICKKSEISITPFKNKTKRLSVDHNHKTGKIRGLLCNNCNLALGNFKDSIRNLKNAIKYLRKT